MASDMAAVWSRSGLVLIAILIAGAAIRLAAIAAGPGYPFDVVTFQRWAARMAAGGPASFYDPALFADYPPGLLYLLWPLGALPGGPPPEIVRAIGIPFDLAIAVVAFAVVRRLRGDRAGLVAAAAYGLDPAPALAGPYWGQVDAVAVLPLILSLVAAAAGRSALAGALGAVAALVKPQLAVGLATLFVAWATRAVRRGERGSLARLVGGAAATALVIALPFGLTVEKIAAIVRDATSTHPFSSLFAFNVWALVTGFAVPDDTTILGLPARVWGLGLVAIAFALVWARTAALAASGRGPFPDELALLLAMTTLATLVLYELPTRIHERYLLPAVALLVPFAFASRRAAIAYVVFSVVLAVSVLFAFTHQEQTGVRATPVLERTLFDPSLLVLLVLAGFGACAGLVSLWVPRRPSLV